jgi:hypothetical protein
VNKQIGGNHQILQQVSIPTARSPMSDDSTWSTSSASPRKEPTTKGINSLIQQQPLHTQMINEVTIDDSRPLSADLKRSSTKSKTPPSTSSEDSDYDYDGKSATIIKSPLTNIIQANIRPTELTETKTTGVENLTKMVDAIMHPSPTNQKQ